MEFKTIGTGSSGNCYALKAGGEILLLDVGIPYKQILAGIDFQIKSVVGCVVSHSHLDHAKAVRDMESAGVPTWKSWEDKPVTIKRFGDFRVISFEVPHDGTDNRGFLIEADGQKVLYVTDFEFCPVSFKNQKLNHIICECNYTPDMLDESEYKYAHVLRGHASLQTTRDFVKANRTGKLRTVVLIHMSAGADIERMSAEIKAVAGTAKVHAASPGETIKLGIAPF